ncbi:hypothetical protein AADR41_13045 [Streptomyces sp. CLV115]|uniref:hypothetical protein n=1 Tax=Streptomyces sp. CLV115 TaxID=3138502 RepID=UPI00313D0E67
MNLWDAEPLPGTRCRIAHRMVCPYLPREDPCTPDQRSGPGYSRVSISKAARPGTLCA